MQTVLIIFGIITFAIVTLFWWLNRPVVYRGIKMSPGEAFEREFGFQQRQDELWRGLTRPREAAAGDMGVTRQSANTYIKELSTKGFVKITRRGQGRPNLYEVNLKKSGVDKRK